MRLTHGIKNKNVMGFSITIISFLALASTASSATVFKQLRTWDCGPADKAIVFRDTFISPSPVVYPGNVSISSHMTVVEDLPVENLLVRVQLDKLEPQRMLVPCMNGYGSW